MKEGEVGCEEGGDGDMREVGCEGGGRWGRERTQLCGLFFNNVVILSHM